MKLEGNIKCKCGRDFNFFTIKEKITCVRCGETYTALNYGKEVVEEPIIEEEVVENDGEVQ